MLFSLTPTYWFMYNHNQAHLTFSLGKNVKHYPSQLYVYTSFPRCYNSNLYLDPHTGDFHLIPMFSLQIQMWVYFFYYRNEPLCVAVILNLIRASLLEYSWQVSDVYLVYWMCGDMLSVLFNVHLRCYKYLLCHSCSFALSVWIHCFSVL